MKKIKGLKVVCGELKKLPAGYSGAVIYDSGKSTVEFDGCWRKDLAVQYTGLKKGEKVYFVDSPMTMRDITKMIAKDFDYELYIKMDLEDKGLI